MLYQNGKILYFNKTSYLKYLQCLLIVLKYDQKFNFVQEIKLQYIQKKKWQASTTTHDLFVNNLKISPTFICRGEVPSNTFAKLPVHVLINDPKNWTKKVHYSHKPIIWSCDLLPQVDQNVFAHFQSTFGHVTYFHK